MSDAGPTHSTNPSTDPTSQERAYFWDDPMHVKRLLQGFGVACVLLMLIDFIPHIRHSSYEHDEAADAAEADAAPVPEATEHEKDPAQAVVEKAEMFPTFYGVYGFLSCVLLVVAAKEMRKLLMRSEDYYDRR